MVVGGVEEEAEAAELMLVTQPSVPPPTVPLPGVCANYEEQRLTCQRSHIILRIYTQNGNR